MRSKPGETPNQIYKSLIKSATTRKWEDLFLFQLKMEGIAPPEQEFKFAKSIGRKWRFDFAWPKLMLAVEVEGGLYIQGRHNRAKGYEADLEKYNTALLLGWSVLRYSPVFLKSGQAIKEVRLVIFERSKEK